MQRTYGLITKKIPLNALIEQNWFESTETCSISNNYALSSGMQVNIR